MDPTENNISRPFLSNRQTCIPQMSIENKPFVGKTFESLKEAEDFYHVYARQGGFSIRRSTTCYFKSSEPNVVKSVRQLRSRLFTCSKQGVYKERHADTNLEKRRQSIRRDN